MGFLYLTMLCTFAILASGSCESKEKPFVQRAEGEGIGENLPIYCISPSKDILFAANMKSCYGDWSEPQWCPTGVLTYFQLRVEPYRGLGVDDTLATSIRFRCSSNPIMEGPGLDWGVHGAWSEECYYGICGIETKMEDFQYGLYDPSLSDIHF